MAAKKITFNSEARNTVKEGVTQLAAAVKETLGPRGRNVVIQRQFGAPLVTKDGVTVANEIELEDPIENVGAQMVKEVASKTSTVAGDGTTTATVYAEAIFNEGMKNVVAGADAMMLKRGIDRAVATVVEDFKSKKQDIADSAQVAQVGTSAANQDAEIGKQIAEAMDRVGKDGVITIEEGKGIETFVDLVEGMQFDKGYISPHFCTNRETLTVEHDRPYILVHEDKLSTIKDLVQLLEAVSQTGRALLIIAEDVDGEALATLVLNHMRGVIKVCAVKAPGFGDRRKAMLEDIAILTGATCLSKELGKSLDTLTLEDLGTAQKVKINKEETILIEGDGNGEDVRGRLEQIKNLISATKSDYETEKLEERLAKLSGGVAQINVGAATEVEMKEKKARIEDALHACRAAIEEGILPGGGVAPLRALGKLNEAEKESSCDDERTGVDIVRRALSAPIKQIARNAGLSPDIVWQKVFENAETNYGYNALTEEYGDMIEMGVLVPAKVERTALQHAASIAGLLLTTNVVITEVPEDTPELPNPAMM